MSVFSFISNLFTPTPIAHSISFVTPANLVEVGDKIDFNAEIEKFNTAGESLFPVGFLNSFPSQGVYATVTRKRFRPNARTRIDFVVADQRHVVTLPDEAVLVLR